MNEKYIYKYVCENDLAFFLRQAFKVVYPEQTYEHNWHVDVLCKHLEAVSRGEIRNLDINIAPRTIKSLLINIVFPAWVWTKDPSKKFITASYAASLSVGFNIRRRSLIKSEWYQSFWPVQIKDDMDTTSSFENKYNGFMKATSVDGSLTGDGSDYLISDDLIDVNDAFSKTKREAARFWFDNTFYNRLNNAKVGSRINVNQRLHEEDITALINEKFKEIDGWESLVIPMVKTDRQVQTSLNWVDPRKVGELMHPSRFGEKEAAIHKSNSYKWSSQYQQSPVPIGGGLIKEEWIRYYDVLPTEYDRMIITADLSFKGLQTSDYVCFMCWIRVGPYFYLVDIVRGKWSLHQTMQHFKAFCHKHPNAGTKYVEDKANGPALISLAEEASNDPYLKGVRPWPEKKPNVGSSRFKIKEPSLAQMSKVERLMLTQPEFENGMVYVPKNIELVETYIHELTSFTEKGSTTGNDDMVDTGTMALIELKVRKKSKFAAAGSRGN